MNTYQFDMLHWIKAGPQNRTKGRMFKDKHFSVATGEWLVSLGFLSKIEEGDKVIYSLTPKGAEFLQTQAPVDGEYEKGYVPRFF